MFLPVAMLGAAYHPLLLVHNKLEGTGELRLHRSNVNLFITLARMPLRKVHRVRARGCAMSILRRALFCPCCRRGCREGPS
jgi:hypothetical protein